MPNKIRLFLVSPPHLISAAKSTGFPLLPMPCPLKKCGDLYHFPQQSILPGGQLLISSAISGGTLAWRLEDAICRFGRDRVVLALERSAMDFPLPAPEGKGLPLSPAALRDRLLYYSPTVFFSQALCAHYFTYPDSGGARFVLFDDAVSLRKKLQIAQTLGLTAAAAAYPQVGDLMDEIRSWQEVCPPD